MSWTETHFGKFKVLARGRENINKYIKEHNLEVENPNYEDLYPIDDKYCIIYPLDKNKSEYLIEFIFSKYVKNDDGTITFAVQFYNGGCCLGEALGDFEK